MSDTRVSVLTPPGVGAIATVELAGPRAWNIARTLFRPAGSKPLPEFPPLHRFWFGTFGEGTGDEVVLAVKQTEPEPRIEVHCHGGRRVVRWVVEQITAHGVHEFKPTRRNGWASSLLPFAPTLRTASVLLDQVHGAFDQAMRDILAYLEAGDTARVAEPLAELARYAPVGRHLVTPWKVVLAGPPNVGKSSLVNALAGYQRSVVSEIAGTTRDVVIVPVAFDGWPVELTDTAGLRDAEGLEGEGIDRATRAVEQADVTVWVLDATAEGPEPDPRASLVLINKIDQPAAWNRDRFPEALRVSAATEEGIPALVAALAHRLVPDPPPPGAAVPFTPERADAVEAAHTAFAQGRAEEAAPILRAVFPSD